MVIVDFRNDMNTRIQISQISALVLLLAGMTASATETVLVEQTNGTGSGLIILQIVVV